MGGSDSQGVWDGHVQAALFKKENSKDLPHAQGLGSVSCGSLDPRGVRGGVDTRVRTAESLPCPPETIAALFIG